MDTRTVNSVQSLDRAFFILELLSNYPQGISLTEICAESNLPKGTVSRMLGTLIQHGYVLQDLDSRKYRLTLRLFEIGSRVVGGANILSIARPYLEKLSRTSEEAVHLVSRVNDEVVYLYKEEATASIVRMSSCVGLHNPMYCTGVGKSILAFLPDEEIQSIWQRTDLIQFTPNTIMTFDKMQEEIAMIRERGYAIDNEEHELGVRCIAAPILDFNFSPVAAISISAPCEHMDEAKIEQYIPMLLDAAKNISRYYGTK